MGWAARGLASARAQPLRAQAAPAKGAAAVAASGLVRTPAVKTSGTQAEPAYFVGLHNLRDNPGARRQVGTRALLTLRTR